MEPSIKALSPENIVLGRLLNIVLFDIFSVLEVSSRPRMQNIFKVIDVEVELTRSHKGYMEWRLCNNPKTETQSCFNQYLLHKSDGSGSKLPVEETGWYKTKLRLPPRVTCERCIIQWNYRAGLVLRKLQVFKSWNELCSISHDSRKQLGHLR